MLRKIEAHIVAIIAMAIIFTLGFGPTHSYADESGQEVQKYELGSKVRVEKHDGYTGEKPITSKDPHNGWDLGHFYVSGYSSTMTDDDGSIIFLKNTGDEVSLSFDLTQNIDRLNGDKDLSIGEDTKASDQYFQTSLTNFGRGMLLVRRTDPQNVKGRVVPYRGYILSVKTKANTGIDLSEEGDYEVALDYQIDQKALLITKESYYRIFFKFKVRNANSMFYMREISEDGTLGNEIPNDTCVTDGFTLDLAKSKYLKLTVVRKVPTDEGEDKSEDVRMNTIAKDGEMFTDPGIYIVTVSNQYTGETTSKNIYVGEDADILKAHAKTSMSVKDIRGYLAQGATIDDNGNIRTAFTKKQINAGETENETSNTMDNALLSEKLLICMEVLIVEGIVIIVILLVIAWRKKGSNSQSVRDGGEEC